MNAEQIKEEIINTIKDNLEQDRKIIILQFEKEQDKKNQDLFARKEVENIIKWIVRITTGALFAGIALIVVSKIIEILSP